MMFVVFVIIQPEHSAWHIGRFLIRKNPVILSFNHLYCQLAHWNSSQESAMFRNVSPSCLCPLADSLES